MANLNVIRAWKDEAYRQSLSDAERAQLPRNPAGLIEMAEEEMGQINGGRPDTYTSYCEVFWMNRPLPVA